MFKLSRYLKPYWWQILILMLSTGVQVWCTLQLPAMMANIINNGISAENQEYIWQTGSLMVVLAIISSLGALCSSYFSSKIGTAFARDLRTEMFTKVISLNVADIKNFSTASLITRTTNDISQVQQTFVMILSMMLRAPLFCVISIVMAIQTAPDMTWIIAAATLAILASIVLIMSLVIPKFKIFQKLIDRTTQLTRENLTGLRVIRAFNNEKLEQNKFEKTNTKLTGTLVFIDKILELQNPLINVIFNATVLVCSWVGVSLIAKDFSYLGNMIAFTEYVTHVMISFLMLSLLFVMLPRANVSATRINEVLSTKDKIRWKKETVGIPDKTPSVEFKHVDFKYEDASEKMLSDISFVAKAGQTTAFIGSTGSGKSTIINIIPRFHDVSAGSVLINGIDVKDYQKDDLIKRIGLVPQRGVLFSGTVKSNIAFGAENATIDQIKRAAKIAQASSFIEKLPGQYDAPISQGGTNVSGGQKQRLSIARAICNNPDIYIFDDSFSALDMKTDANLRAALKENITDAVILIVAQRINTIKDADQIIVLDKGKIVGKGTHKELILKCKIYEEIVKSQLSEKEYKEEIDNARA